MKERWRIDILDTAEFLTLQRGFDLVKKIKEFFDFFRWKKSNIALDLWQDKTTRVWSLVIWNFPNNERSFGFFQITRDLYSYTLRVAIEDIIDILKNINNESRWRIDISILQSSRLCRGSMSCQKDQRSSLIFSVGKIKHCLWSFDKTTRGNLISRYLEFSK